MSVISKWGKEFGIPDELINELFSRMSAINTEPSARIIHPRSEAAISTDIRLEAAAKGGRLFRNNVGACQDKRGRLIRYGLCNDSKAMNQTIKSHDLVGIMPVKITPEHLDLVIGQFISREVKHSGWIYDPNDERQIAQQRFSDLINSLGGDARFVNDVGSL